MKRNKMIRFLMMHSIQYAASELEAMPEFELDRLYHSHYALAETGNEQIARLISTPQWFVKHDGKLLDKHGEWRQEVAWTDMAVYANDTIDDVTEAYSGPQPASFVAVFPGDVVSPAGEVKRATNKQRLNAAIDQFLKLSE